MLNSLKFADIAKYVTPSLKLIEELNCSKSMHYQFNVSPKPVNYPKRELVSFIKSNEQQILNGKHTKYDRNYYAILGLTRTANNREIKNAYYLLAKKFHPDTSRTVSEEKTFQEISEAYHVLSDEHKRNEYDRNGVVKNIQAYLQSISTKSVHKITDDQRRLNEILKIGTDSDKRKSTSTFIRNEAEINITFMESVKGIKKNFTTKCLKKCPKCNGMAKLSWRTLLEMCRKCRGSGFCTVQTKTYTTHKLCDSCNGKRFVAKNLCKICENRGYVIRDENVYMEIPAGIKSGDTLTVPHPTERNPLSVTVTVNKSETFKRTGNHIFSEKYLSLTQAILGGRIKIQGIKEDIEVKLDPGVQSESVIRFHGKGICSKNLSGDHVVTFKVKIPKNLSKKQRDLILELAKIERNSLNGELP